jgi:hypothetical protein
VSCVRLNAFEKEVLKCEFADGVPRQRDGLRLKLLAERPDEPNDKTDAERSGSNHTDNCLQFVEIKAGFFWF